MEQNNSMHLEVSVESPALSSMPAWFCVRSQPKREHIAAAHLRNLVEVEVFCPRLRIRKATRRGGCYFYRTVISELPLCPV